jgi:hypothetical protein
VPGSGEAAKQTGYKQTPQNPNEKESAGYNQPLDAVRVGDLLGCHCGQYIARRKKGPSHRAPTGQLRGCVRSEFCYWGKTEARLWGHSFFDIGHVDVLASRPLYGQHFRLSEPAVDPLAEDVLACNPTATETRDPASAVTATIVRSDFLTRISFQLLSGRCPLALFGATEMIDAFRLNHSCKH